MIDFTAIQDALYEWIVGVPVNMPVIWQDQAAPRPSSAYITLLLAPLTHVAHDYLCCPDEIGQANIYGNREFTLLITHFGEGGMQRLEFLRSTLERPTVQQFLSTKGIAFVDRLMIVDTTDLVDSRREPRCNMDLVFRVCSQDSDNTGFIDRVDMEQTFKGSSIVRNISIVSQHLEYTDNPVVYVKDIPITTNNAIPTGFRKEDGILSFSVAPQLPDGLSIDINTGEITGTPTSVKEKTVYTARAFNNAVVAGCLLSIEITA